MQLKAIHCAILCLCVVVFAPGPSSAQTNAISPALSASLAAFRARVTKNWVQSPDGYRGQIVINVRIGRNKLLRDNIQVVSKGDGDQWIKSRDNIIRAVFASQPFDMLRDDDYSAWNDMEIEFVPTPPPAK